MSDPDKMPTQTEAGAERPLELRVFDLRAKMCFEQGDADLTFPFRYTRVPRDNPPAPLPAVVVEGLTAFLRWLTVQTGLVFHLQVGAPQAARATEPAPPSVEGIL